ncbi:hypothetical protein niasHT_014061 [Heterodera trifolii]|uniref:RNA helicase n=1 Tax=Heterodera trifolii TaxID=157864 RepID=A0ABD2LG68_9BILA
MSSGSRGFGRGRGGRGSAPSQTENGTTHLPNDRHGANSVANPNEGTIIDIDFSDSQPSQQPPIVNVPAKGILRNCNGIDAASDVQKANGTATNEGEHHLPIADQPVPFGGASVPRVASVAGRGTRGVRGGLGRGAAAQSNNISRPPVNAETSPPKTVTFDSTTVFNGRARGGGGTTSRGSGRGANAVELGPGDRRGFGRGANAVELNTSNDPPSIGTILRGGGRGRGRGMNSEGQNGGLGNARPNAENNERGRGSYGDRRGGGRGSERDGDERFGRGRGGGGRPEFGERPPNHSQRGPSANRGDERFPRDEPGPSRPRHIYKKRPIECLYEEDCLVSERYVDIRDEDEDLVVSGDNVEKFTAYETWKDFGLEPKLLENINRCKYVVPRKIQSYTFPLIRDGFDVKAHAETSSGKSAAFFLPIIDKIMKLKKEGTFKSRRSCPYALILSPTRELAIQVYEQGRKLCNGCDVSISLAYGETARHENIRNISIDGCDILVGTPGRTCDFFQSKNLMFDLLKVFVLDEADKLLDDSFILDMRLLGNMPNWPTTELRQTLFFSATFSKDVLKWADDFMRPNPVLVSKGKITPNKRIKQTFVLAESAVKRHTLVRLLQLEKEQNEQVDSSKKLRSTMVFVNTRKDTEIVCNFLTSRGFSATTINGGRAQPTREKAVWDFKTGEFPIIVTTDVCARGHDIKNLERVINLDLPCADSAEDAYYKYVQRIGRTGRIQQGMSTTFFDPATDMDLAQLLVEGVNRLSQSVPSWLQSAATDGFVKGQGSSLSDQNLLSSAGIPQMPNSVPNFDFPPPPPPPPPNDLQNGHNGLSKEQSDEQTDDSADDLFDLAN